MSDYSSERVKELILEYSKITGSPYMVGTNIPINERSLDKIIKSLEKWDVEYRQDYIETMERLVKNEKEFIKGLEESLEGV